MGWGLAEEGTALGEINRMEQRNRTERHSEKILEVENPCNQRTVGALMVGVPLLVNSLNQFRCLPSNMT